MKKNLVELIENAGIQNKKKIEIICVDAGLIPVEESKKGYTTEKLIDLLGLYANRDNGSLFYSKDKQNLNEMAKAIKNKDSYKQGSLYGFPDCCIKYFTESERQGKAPLIENLTTIRKRLENNQPTPAYFRSYVLCPDCIGTKDSPAGYAERQIAEVLKANSPKLYEDFKKIRNSKWIYFPSTDNLAVLQFEGSDKKLKRNLMYVG